MRFADILKMCFDSLSRRKGRTILTVLGVFIGCTSIRSEEHTSELQSPS